MHSQFLRSIVAHLRGTLIIDLAAALRRQGQKWAPRSRIRANRTTPSVQSLPASPAITVKVDSSGASCA